MKVQGVDIALVDGEAARDACIAITATIPEWFGQPSANAHYAAEIGNCDCLVARRDGAAIGLIALRYHFETTAEIWWLGVDRAHHRTGAGRALIEQSIERARQRRCTDVVLETLSPEHPDPGYAETRRFYLAMGFRLLVPAARGSGGHPMVLMARSIPGRGDARS